MTPPAKASCGEKGRKLPHACGWDSSHLCHHTWVTPTLLPPLCTRFCKSRRNQRDAWNQRGKPNFKPTSRFTSTIAREKQMCCEGGLSSALYASFLDSPVFSSAGSTVKFAQECNNSIFLTADLTHFFPFMKQHVHGDLEPLITSCREVPWKLGRRTHR